MWTCLHIRFTRPPALRSWRADVEDNWRMCRNASSLNCHIPTPPYLLHGKSRTLSCRSTASHLPSGFVGARFQLHHKLGTRIVQHAYSSRVLGKYRMLIYYKLFEHVRVWQLKLYILQSHMWWKRCFPQNDVEEEVNELLSLWVAVKVSRNLPPVYGEPQCLLFELLSMAWIHHTWAAVKMISVPISVYPSYCQ